MLAGLNQRFAPLFARYATRRNRAKFTRVERALYILWCGLWTIASARTFYGYMMKQTGGEWSAPLDDVFIHFDYARATALGHPFEWVVGNGYSSGNTSLLYPFVLALGWLGGFREERLMIWAAVVAMVSVFGVLLAARRVCGQDTYARASSYVLAPMFLMVGALDWSLWSGMEVAIFLATWALALLAFFALDDAPRARVASRAWILGACGALMVVTRPEASTTIAAFGIAAALTVRTRFGLRTAIVSLGCIALPSVVVLAAQSIANRVLTGEWSANGAVVKLALNSPYLTGAEKFDDYAFNLRFAVFRNLEHHFTDMPRLGFIVPALGLAALAFDRSRRIALVLWAQIVGWLVLVALNGQVRWQNERYTMPAVAWVLIASAIGVATLVRRIEKPRAWIVFVIGALSAQAIGIAMRTPGATPLFFHVYDYFPLGILAPFAIGAVAMLAMRAWPLRVAAVLAGLVVFHQHEAAKFRDQVWFFGRACRNIRDQHVVAGRWLGKTNAHRLLVGDAGALIYASDKPGLDIIGLGGFKDLPFARASQHGLPATIELMERVPERDRPDVFAIFPTWWGILPTWFASDVVARFPAEGNVICGGYEDVIYTADWHLLGSGAKARAIPSGESVIDEVDVADLLNEHDHAYKFPTPGGGWTEMEILPDPLDIRADMFDGGRRISAGRSETMKLRGLTPNKSAHLIVRTAPDGATRAQVKVGGAPVGVIEVVPTEAWVERAIAIPADRVTETIDVEIANDGPRDFVDYHVWITQ